jgi:hypothetical protein
MNLVPTLPYAEAYRNWAGHMTECGQCFTVMDAASGGTQEIEDLCSLGEPLATLSNWSLEDQRVMARLN